MYIVTSAGTSEIRMGAWIWGSSGGADLAEEYLVEDDTVTPGDVVSLTDQKYYIDKAIASSSYPALGIVSTKPGIVLKDWNYNPQNTRNVALSGRVPVKISEENGVVNTGDRLTVSATLPGYAMKMTEPGQSVGIAMESSQAKKEDKILVFLNLSYWSPDINQLLTNTASASNEALNTKSYLDSLLYALVSRLASLFNIVFENGLVKAAKGIFVDVESEIGVTTKDQITGEAYCIQVRGGVTVTLLGKCSEQNIQNITTSEVTTSTEILEAASHASETSPSPTSDVQIESTLEATLETTSEVTSEPTSESTLELTSEMPESAPEPISE